MSHPSATEIEDFVSGAIDPNADLVSHVSTCEACAALVRGAARVELALHETGDAARFCVACGCVATQGRCSSCGAALSVRGYRVVAVLASGPLGRVYAAVDPSGVRVAVKELAFVGMARADALAAFEREARVLERLTHPGIPRFVDSFSEGRGVEARAYLVQELIEGESLAARLARQQLSEPEVVEIARQVIEILVYLQSLSPMVFHRDIKPANLIQRPDGSIALVDFGAARDLGSTAGATVVGTFGYMPIEQLAGIVDATTDLHALGATLWHLCTRIEPWRLWADSLLQRRANVSPALRRFLDKLVARDARRRFSGAVAARAALAASSDRWATLRPMLGWAAAAALLIATATGGFVAARAHGWFAPASGDGLAARTDELNRLTREYGLKLAERDLEHKVQLLSVDDGLLRSLNNDDLDVASFLARALPEKHVDGLVVLDPDGKVLASAGNIDAQGLAAERYTPPLAEPKASVRRIGEQNYLVASVKLTFFGSTLGQLVAAEHPDISIDEIAPKAESSRSISSALSQRNLRDVVDLLAHDDQLREVMNFGDKSSAAVILKRMNATRQLAGLAVVDSRGAIIASTGTLDPQALLVASAPNASGVPRSMLESIGRRRYFVAGVGVSFLGNQVGELIAAQATDSEGSERMSEALADFGEISDPHLFRSSDDDRRHQAQLLADFNRSRHLDGLLLLDAKGRLLASAGTLDPQALLAAYDSDPSKKSEWTTHRIGTRSYEVANAVVSHGSKKDGELVIAQAVEDDSGVQSLTETKAASVSIVTAPSGASVTMDGKVVATTPAHLRSLTEGMHHLVLELPGYEPSVSDLRIKAGEEGHVLVELTEKPAP